MIFISGIGLIGLKVALNTVSPKYMKTLLCNQPKNRISDE